MEEEIEGVIESSFDVRFVKFGVIYYFYFAEGVFYSSYLRM